MSGKSAWYILAGQACLFGGLFACFLLSPHFLLEPNEGGVSNYGLYARTVVPYTVAFGGAGLSTLLTAHSLSEATLRYQALRRMLTYTGWLFLAILLSTYPYKLNQTWNNIHLWIGMLSFWSEMGLSVWMAAFLDRGRINLILLVTQLGGFVLAALTFFGALHVLFIAEFITSLAFGAVLVRTVGRLTTATRS